MLTWNAGLTTHPTNTSTQSLGCSQLGYKDLKEAHLSFQIVSYTQQETLALKKKLCKGSMNFQRFSPCHSPSDWLKLTVHQLDLPCTSTPYKLESESSSFTFPIGWYWNSPGRKSSASPPRLCSAGLAAVASPRGCGESQRWSHQSLTFKAYYTFSGEVERSRLAAW